MNACGVAVLLAVGVCTLLRHILRGSYCKLVHCGAYIPAQPVVSVWLAELRAELRGARASVPFALLIQRRWG